MSHAHQESTKNASCLVEPSKPMNFLKTSKPVSFRHQKHSNLGIWVNFMIFGICPQPRNLGFPTPKLGYFFDTDFLGRSTTQDFHPKLLFLEEILTCSTWYPMETEYDPYLVVQNIFHEQYEMVKKLDFLTVSYIINITPNINNGGAHAM